MLWPHARDAPLALVLALWLVALPRVRGRATLFDLYRDARARMNATKHGLQIASLVRAQMRVRKGGGAAARARLSDAQPYTVVGGSAVPAGGGTPTTAQWSELMVSGTRRVTLAIYSPTVL